MISDLITSFDHLPPALAASVTAEERAAAAALSRRGELPFAVTPHYAALINGGDAAGCQPPGISPPLRRMAIPSAAELAREPYENDDPLGEAGFRAAPRLVHQYRDRALLLAGGECAGYCRFCFRRVRQGGFPAFITEDETSAACAYLAAHGEIREVLVSGGDPLTADNAALDRLFAALRRARPGVLLRVCTRAPVTLPSRLDAETIAFFSRWKPLRVVAHVNHPRELDAAPGGPGAGEVLATCVDSGVPVHIQTVLLRGVNDDARTLAALFRRCLDAGLTPYYLFQLDLAPGTAQFRVPIERGLALYREVAALISGLGLPAYAVDLPGGGGKIRLTPDSIAGEEGGFYLLKDSGGTLWKYPKV
jgi:lysine 2,3-aminomutase